MSSTNQLMTDPALYEQFAALNTCFDAINDHIIGTIRQLQSKKKRPLTILDLGAGTGLQVRMLAREFPNAKIFAVEQDKKFFAYLKKTTEKFSNITTSLGRFHATNKHNPLHLPLILRGTKGVTARLDIVIIRFVYHHVPDKLKTRFLRNIRTYLKQGSVLIVIEECLGEYSNQIERDTRDEEYHLYRIKLAKLTGNPDYVAYQTKTFSLNLCPYKVSQKILKQQLLKTGSKIVESALMRGTDTRVDYNLLGHAIVIARK